MIKSIIATCIIALGLAGCAGGQLNQDALKAVKIPFQLYTGVYQPLLIEYGKLPDCTPMVVAVCRDYKLYSKLVEVDGKTVVAMQVADAAVAQGTTDGDVLTRAATAVSEAMVAMAPLIAEAQTGGPK